MGGLGFGQGAFGQYAVQEIPQVPPTYVSSTELAASYVAFVEYEATYIPATDDIPASIEGSAE